MLPAIVFPLHDPDGVMLPHLEAITSQLKAVFERAFLNLSLLTHQKHPGAVSRLQADSFFQVTCLQESLQAGEQFRLLFWEAANACPPQQVLHLCFIDRLAFALQSEHREAFLDDLQTAADGRTPLLFQRSQAAWETHPSNYRDIEWMASRVGEYLFGRTLDFTWCHLAVQAGQLAAVLPRVHSPGLNMLAEIVLLLHDDIQTMDVDWLAWEDPFLYAGDAAQMKAARQRSAEETQKRLAYVIPTLQLLSAHHRDAESAERK